MGNLDRDRVWMHWRESANAQARANAAWQEWIES